MRPKNISFIIISPLLGYRSGNKVYHLDKEINLKIEMIQDNFYKPDIVNIVGKKDIQRLKHRIIQNQFYYDTGEAEQIKLGLYATIYNKIVILKDNCDFNPELIKTGIKKGKDFITTGYNPNNAGLIVNNGVAINISYGIPNKYGDVFYVHNRLKEVEKFVNLNHNRNKMTHEIIQHLINIEPICVY